jgi:hypothetical protein
MLKTIKPSDAIEDVGTEEFIRELRKLWIRYADPKYIDLLDASQDRPLGFKKQQQ